MSAQIPKTRICRMPKPKPVNPSVDFASNNASPSGMMMPSKRIAGPACKPVVIDESESNHWGTCILIKSFSISSSAAFKPFPKTL